MIALFIFLCVLGGLSHPSSSRRNVLGSYKAQKMGGVEVTDVPAGMQHFVTNMCVECFMYLYVYMYLHVYVYLHSVLIYMRKNI